MTRSEAQQIAIASRDYWFKVVASLQQNWALIEERDGAAIVYFLDDSSSVFDEMPFAARIDAESALQRNGFQRYAEDQEAAQFIAVPQPPLVRGSHPSGPIYSGGKFWI